MTFPQLATRQKAIDREHDHDAIVATVMARQAESKTARAMVMARLSTARPSEPSNDVVRQRIHYFGSSPVDGEAPCGSFLCIQRTKTDTDTKSESSVYQNDSTNIKAHDLQTRSTGEQANQSGHGASRTL